MRAARRRYEREKDAARTDLMMFGFGADMMVAGITGLVNNTRQMIAGAYDGTHPALTILIERGVVDVRLTAQSIVATPAALSKEA